MPVQIFPEQPGLGTLLGTGLGAGIGESLEALAQQKMGQYAQRRQSQRTQKGMELIQSGIPQNVAQGFSLLPDKLKPEALKGMRMQGQAQNLENRLSALYGEGQQTPGQPAPQDAPTYGAPVLSEKGVENLYERKQEFITEARKDSKDKWTFNKELYRDTNRAGNLAKEHRASYKAQMALARSGKLTNPSFYSFLKKVGLDRFAAFLNPASESYLKITQDFVKNIKEVFGARITDRQIEEFLKALPTLQNTDEGKQLILDFLMLKGDATSARAETMRDIIREHGGTPPYELGGLLSERSGPIYENLGDQFLNIVERATQLTSGMAQQFSAGQDISTEEVKGLPEGTVLKRGNKRYKIKNGKPVVIR